MKKTVIWSGNSRAQLAAIDRENAMRILHALDDYLTEGSGDIKSCVRHAATCVSASAITASFSYRLDGAPSKSLGLSIAHKPIEAESGRLIWISM